MCGDDRWFYLHDFSLTQTFEDTAQVSFDESKPSTVELKILSIRTQEEQKRAPHVAPQSQQTATTTNVEEKKEEKGEEEKLILRGLNHARVDRVKITNPLDADWHKKFFQLAITAIERRDIRALRGCLGPLVQFDRKQRNFFNKNVHAQLGTLQNEALAAWLTHLQSCITMYGRYSADEFAIYVVQSINNLTEEFRKNVSLNVKPMEQDRINRGALLTEDDVKTRYLECLVKKYVEKLNEAMKQLGKFVAKNNLLDRKLSTSEKEEALKLIKDELAQRVVPRKRDSEEKKKETDEKFYLDLFDSMLQESRTQLESKEEVTSALRSHIINGGILDFNVFRDAKGNTLMHHAMRAFTTSEKETLTEREDRQQIIEMLFQAGLSPFVTNLLPNNATEVVNSKTQASQLTYGQTAFRYAEFNKNRKEQTPKSAADRSKIALLYWEITYWAGHYLPPSCSHFLQLVTDKVNTYSCYAINNLKSGGFFYWLFHNWETSNIERPDNVLKLYEGIDRSDRDLCEQILLDMVNEIRTATAGGIIAHSILNRGLDEVAKIGDDQKLLAIRKDEVAKREAVLAGEYVTVERELEDTRKREQDEKAAREKAEREAKRKDEETKAAKEEGQKAKEEGQKAKEEGQKAKEREQKEREAKLLAQKQAKKYEMLLKKFGMKLEEMEEVELTDIPSTSTAPAVLTASATSPETVLSGSSASANADHNSVLTSSIATLSSTATVAATAAAAATLASSANVTSNRSSNSSKGDGFSSTQSMLAVSLQETLLQFLEKWQLAQAMQQSLQTTSTISRTENLNTEAKRWGFECTNVLGDGNCFFHAVEKQLKTQDAKATHTHATLREVVLQNILDHLDEYKSFNDRPVDEWIGNLAQNGTWADDLVVVALSRTLNMTIAIARSDRATPTIIRQKDAKGVLYLGYEVGVHYQSLTPLANNNLSEIKKLIEAAPFDQPTEATNNSVRPQRH